MRVSALLLGLLLSTSCGTASTNRVVTIPVEPCQIPTWPLPPMIEAVPGCPEESVCLSIRSTVEIGTWIREVIRIHDNLRACKNVLEVPPATGSLTRWWGKSTRSIIADLHP